MLSWLAQEGPHASKHHGWAHPVAVAILHYTILVIVSCTVHDWMVLAPLPLKNKEELADSILNTDNADFNSSGSQITQDCHSLRQRAGTFLACYFVWLIVWRLVFCPPTIPRQSVIYESTWLCNGTLALGALASWTHRPILAMACCVTVGIDQLLWYVDLLGFVVSGKFPVGVAKYLTWPQTTWITRVTCTHHLWTIPLLMATSGGSVPISALGLSFILMTLNVCLSRFLIPFEVIVPVAPFIRKGSTSTSNDKDDYSKSKSKYLNVNLSHELWKDIKIELIQINYDNPPVFRYIFRLLWRWQGFNTMVFGVLVVLGQLIFRGDHHVCKTPS